MIITLNDVGKRFNHEWIFRHVHARFQINNPHAIVGSNGSGKSTLLPCISGALMFNEGTISYLEAGQSVDAEKTYTHISLAAPYLELIEEMTALELIDFHSAFKKWVYNPSEILNKAGLNEAAHKQIRFYSSGMKQRLKLAQAFFSETRVLLLDEPCSNLDITGVEMYRSWINDYTKDRIVIIASNDKQEYDFCKESISMSSFKSSSPRSNQ